MKRACFTGYCMLQTRLAMQSNPYLIITWQQCTFVGSCVCVSKIWGAQTLACMLSVPPWLAITLDGTILPSASLWNQSFPLAFLSLLFAEATNTNEGSNTSEGSQCTGSYQTGCNQARKECLYQATWLVLGERVQFNVSARVDTNSWVAIGFSDNMMMVSG